MTQPANDTRDLVILGGGLVGMTLALAAATKGFSSHVIDRADPAELTAEGFDDRATAISTASWHLFENIGIAAELEQFACDIASIAVTDQNKPGRLDFVPGEGGGTLGRMFPNRRLRLALFEAAAKEPLINWSSLATVTERQRSEYGVAAVLADGRKFKGRLMIAAEGRQSPTRDSAHGIHPSAGQGLNLGLRDVGALVEVLADGARLGLDPGDPELLKRYETWRGLDSFMVALATDGLTRLFGVPGKTASVVRRLGMAAVQRTPMLKSFFMDEARGVSGDLPAILRG